MWPFKGKIADKLQIKKENQELKNKHGTDGKNKENVKKEKKNDNKVRNDAC